MTVIFAVVGCIFVLALSALALSLVAFFAKEIRRGNKEKVIIECGRPLTMNEIDALRRQLREQGLAGAIIISGGKAHVVWPNPRPLRPL